MDPGRPQQQDKKQLLQQQQLLLQKQLNQQHQHQQLLKLQQQQFKQQQQLKPQQQLLQSQPNSQPQQQVLQSQPQYLQQQLPPNQQPLLIQNQDFMKQRSMQHGNLNQQQLLEHQKNQDQAIIELLTLHDNNKYEDKNQEDCLILQRQQVIQQQQQPSLQRQQPLQQLQSQLMQQSQQPQHHQQQSQILQQPQQQFQSVQQLQNVSQLHNLQQLQTVQQPQLITKAQVIPKTQVEHQPQVVRQPPAVQKPNSLQQPQIVQQQNNQYSPVSTQQQSKKQPPPHTQQLLQQQLQQLLLKNKNYPQRIVVLGNQPQQQQLSPQQPQRVVSNSTNQQPQQMQCVVVTNTGQQPSQMQRVVVTGTSQQQQQQQIQRVMVGNNGQPQSQQMQRVVVPTTITHQQMQRVVVTSTGQQVQQQQLQHVIIPGTSQQHLHQVQNVVTQTSIQQQPQQLQRVVVAQTSQQQVQRVVTSTSSQQQQQQQIAQQQQQQIVQQQQQQIVQQQQQQIAQQHQPVSQRIVIGQLKTSQQTQQMQPSSQNGVVLNQQVIQRPVGSIQQQQRVVIAGQQQILKLANQQPSQQQITLQKQLAHKLLQPTHQQQQQDVVINQQQQLDIINQYQQQDVLKNQQKQLDVVKNKHQQQDIIKKQQQQQDVLKKLQQQQDLVITQLQKGQISQGTVVSLTQQQKNNLDLSNESLAKELHIKQSHQQLQQLHIQPSQKHSQEQINKQLQQQKLKQKKEIDQLKHQLKQPRRSGVIVGQLQQPEKPEPEKLKRQLEIQQQQRQKLQERLLLQQRQQQQQQQKLKEQQLQQKRQQQLREQVLLQQHLKQQQQHLKQQQQQQIQKNILLKHQASSENRLSLVVSGIQDQKIRDEEKTINSHEKSREPQPFRELEKATGAENQYQTSLKRNYNENLPVSEKDLLLSSSSSDDDDDDNTMRNQRNLVREAERLVQERYDTLKVVLGSKYQDQYDDILRNWLANRLSREEFDREIRKVLYVSWIAMTKNVDGDNNYKNASIKTNNTTSKKTFKKDSVATISKIEGDNGSLINSSAHKSSTLKKVAEINEDIDFDFEKKEVKDILSERVPLHNALVTSLLTWLPLNCQWLEQRKARSQGVSETGAPLRLYTFADVPQARGPSDHWYPNVSGSLAHWFWPNNLPCKSSSVENDEYSIPKISFHEQEKKKVADAVAAAVLINPPSSKLLPLLMEVAENKEKVRRARQLQYQKWFPKKQNAKVTKRLQLQRLQEQKRLDIMVRLRNGCSKLLRELKKRLRCLANQESQLIEQLRHLQIRMSRRRRQVLSQFKIREKDLKFRIRKFFDRSYLEEPNIDFKEHLHTDDSTIEDDETDDDEIDNEKEPQQNVFKQHWKEVNLLEKNHGKKLLKTTIADHKSKRYVRAQRPQSTALTIRLLRDRQRFLATTRLLQVTKQEQLQISSNADYVRKVRNNNCPCGESYNKPCQYRRRIRHLRKKLRAYELEAIKEKIDQELVRKAAEKEKVDAEELQKTTAIEIEKRKADTHNKEVVTKSTKKKKPVVTKKNINVEAEEKKCVTATKDKTVDNSLVKTNAITDISTSKKTTSLVNTNTKNVETMVRQTLDNLDRVNKRKQNIGINCELLIDKSPQQARFDSLADTRNRLRPPLPKDKRSVVNVADAAARAAQAALAASKKTQIRKTRAAAAAAAAAAASATCAGTVSSSGKDDNDRRASELMPPPPPPPLLQTAPSKTVTIPKNPSNGARYLQQQQYLLDRHRQLERIRRDEEERRQRAQDEQQEQEGSDIEDDETNMKMEDVSSTCLPSSQRMISKRQKVPVGTIRQDMNRENDKEDQEEFSSVNRCKAKNREESQKLSDYYFYYGGGDYYSSDEESSGSSFIEPPFPPLLHDLRIDQLPRPTNRLPAAAILPPGVRTRLQPIQLSNSKIDAVESSVERREERTILETDHGRSINDLVEKKDFDHVMDFRIQNPLNSYVVSNTCKFTESADKKSAQKKCYKVNKDLQSELVLRRRQQQMQQGKMNDTNILLEQRKPRQDADKLPGAKKTFEQIQQERQENGKPILKTNPLTEWSKQDSKQVTTSSVTKTNSYNKDQSKKHLVNQLQQQNSDNKMIGSVSSNRGKEPDTRVDVEELRSVQWKAPLTQWNKRPVTYEAAVTQRYPIQNKGNDSPNSLKEKVVTYTSEKFDVSNHYLNDQQHKLRSEVDEQKFKRIEIKNMVFEYQKLVDTLPQNEQLQHMAQLQRYLRPPGNIIEKTTVKCNPSVEKQEQPSVESTNNSCILLDNSTSLLNLPDDGQERTVLKQIGNLLLKIKNQQEEMYQNVVISDEIKRFPRIVSNKLEINNVEENVLKNWRDLWPAYEGMPNNDELMNEEERLRQTQELINRYYSCNNDEKSVRSLDQQKRRLGRYGRERLERELPAYQQLRMAHIMQSETSARPNLPEQQVLKLQKLQHTEQHSPERQKYLERYKRLRRIEQLEQQKRLVGDQQQQLNEQKIQQLQNKQQQDSNVGRSSIQQQRSQCYFMVGKCVESSTLCYDEELPLRDQLLRRIVKNKYEQLIKVIQQQQRSKSTTVPITANLPDITIRENVSKANTMRKTNIGSQLWWRSIGLERKISPLVTGVDNQVDLEETHVAVMPISNLPQVTRPQIDSKVATVVEVKPKVNTVATNKIILQNWMEPRLISMMTNNEEKWLEQLQSKISQLDQQVDLHWKAMINKQEQQVKLLLDCDKHLQWEKEKKRLEREKRIHQLKKRTPFQALPVHHQQAHSLRAAGHMQQQQSEIPIIVIDDDGDDDEEPLHDTTIVFQKRNTHQHPVFIDDDLVQHTIETKILYEDQHKGVSNRWKQLEIVRRAHQKLWKFKLKQLFSYKTTNRQFCGKLFERMMSKIENPNLIKALEYLNGEPFKFTERQQFQQQMGLSEPQPMQEQPRMLHRQKDPTQKQAAINHSQRTPIKQKKHKTAKSSKKTIKEQRSTHKLAIQHPLNKQGNQKLEKQLPQNLINTNKNQPKKTYEHQESINIRQLRSKKHVVVSHPSQKRSKQSNHLNQNKQKKSPIKQHIKQVTRRRFQRGQLLKRVKTPAMSSRHMFLLRNRILQVHLNRNKRLRKQKQRSVPKQNIIIDTREMQIQKSRNKFTKLVLKTMAYSLYNHRSSLQRQLERLNETHPDKIDNQLEPSVSKTLIMSVRKPSITSMILSPQKQSTIKQQSLTSTLKLCPQRPSTSIEQPSTSSVMLISHIPMQPYQPTASTSANQQCQQSQEVGEKRQALKQKLNKVHSKLQPLMEMWQLSNQLPGRWLLQQLDDIEELRQKEVSVKSMLDLSRPSVQQQKQHIPQNNEVSVMMDSTTITMCSLQQLQRIREHLNWRQQRLRDLIEDLLILICPEQHPMLSDTTQLSSNCSVLIKLQQHPILMEPINSAYSAVLKLQSPSSSKHTQQQFSTYSLLLKLNQPMMTKQQSLMYSTVLKLQQPPMQKQTSCLPMMITSQQPSIAFVSKNIIHNPSPSNNKRTHRHNNQLQEKRRLSSGDETNDNCKRLKSSNKKRSKAPFDSVSYKQSVTSHIKNTGIDKSLPIISLVDSDDDIETLDSDSSTESSNKAGFGVQVSEKSPLTIKIIKKKPPSGTPPVITDIENNSEIHNMRSVIKCKEYVSNIDSNKGLELTKNKYFNKDKTIQIDVNSENLKKIISINQNNEDDKTFISEQNNIKDVMTGTSVHKTIVGRPTQIAAHVNRPKETVAVMNKPSVPNDSNQILKAAVVECSSTMISNVDSKCINVVPDGRKTIKMMGGVINSKYINSVDRTTPVINKLSEVAVSVIRRTPMALAQSHQPAVDQIPTPIITPTGKSNMKITKSIDKSQSCNNSTENTKNIKKSRAVTTNRIRRIGTLSKTVRRYRRLNRTLSSETRGPAVFTFRDHGFAQGTVEQIIHGRFMTTILTMSAAHTIASYIPPSLPRIPFDYASMYQCNFNVASTNINEDNTSNNQNIKLANTSVTPLSSIMSWIEKTVKISSNIACGNGHVWKGCARASGPILMTLSKETKEAIARKNDIQSRATSLSHLTAEVEKQPATVSRSSRKKPIPVIANSTNRSEAATVPISPISNSNGKQQINTERSTFLTSIATPSSLDIMTTSYTPLTKNVAGLSSSLPSVELHNGSKSAIGVASPSRKQQSNSVVQPTKRSALEAFSSVPLLTSKITTDIVVPALETEMLTPAIVGRPQKRSKSAVTTTDTSTIDVSPTLTKPSQRGELLKSVKRSASVAGYASSPITSKMSDLSPPAGKPPKRSKSAVVITPVSEAAAASSNNLIQSRSIKRSASMALSPPPVRKTNKSKLTVPTLLSFNKTSTIQSRPKLAEATIPERRVSRTLNILKTMPPAETSEAAPNVAKNNVFNNAVFETGDEENSTYEKTTTITDEDQRTVTVTRTLCPAIPAPMDVTADACSLVTAACEQFIKAMVMERHLKAGRGAGTLQLHRRDAFAAAIAVDDEIRPFPDYRRTPVIETTTVYPVISVCAQGENNDVGNGTASEQKSVITDSRYNTKSIVMTIDKPDHEDERRAVLKQQSIIADSESNNKLSLLTVKTVIETQTTSSTTTTINKLQCPTTITTDSNAKTRSSRSVIKGTSARTRGEVIFKKIRSSMTTSESTMPSSSDQPSIGNQLSAEPTAARKQSMRPPPFITPNTTAKHPSVIGEATNKLLEVPFDAKLTFNSSMSTRGFFVHRGGPLNNQPALNRRQPFGKLVTTCTRAAVDTAAANNAYFSDDRGQNLDTKGRWPYDDPTSNVWGCYLSNPKMLPPVSRFNNFFNTADELKVPSSENHGGGNGFSDDDDDTGYLVQSSASTKLLHDMVKVNGYDIQEQISLANTRRELLLTELAYQQQHIEELENEMKWRFQEYQNGKPDSQKVYYKKFQKLQYGSSNPARFSSNGHSIHSMVSW